MRKIGSKKRFALIATTVAAVFVGGGVAVAYWTTTGTGSGTAATGTSSTVTVAQVGTISGLYPGGAAVAIPFSITNSNVSAQRVSTVAVAVTGTRRGAVAEPGCTAADFTVTNATIAVDVPGGGATTNFATGNGATILMKNTALNQDACKLVTIDFSLTAS